MPKPRPSFGAGPSPLVTASWYRDANRPADALYAAMPGVRWGSPVRFVAVCSYLEGTTRCVTVPVVDYCGCDGGRAIDLSPAAFASLADLDLGLVRVSIEPAS